MNDFAQHSRTGWIEVISGPMSGGKTEELQRRLRRAMIARRALQVFKPVIDDRYFGIDAISSHDGRKIPAIPVRDAAEIERRVEAGTEVVGIDEVQFFSTHIVGVARRLAGRGVRVICAGLDMDYTGTPFPPMPELFAVAEQVDKYHAICPVCAEPATRTQRLLDGEPAPAGGPVVMVGGLAKREDRYSYEARCAACHVVPRADPAQLEMPGPVSMPPQYDGRDMEDWRWAVANGGRVDPDSGAVLDWGPAGKPDWA